MRALNTICLFVLTASLTTALSPAKWRSQSVYQVLTDRFARTDGSTTAPCDPAEDGGVYCNGTFTGLINHLDYIQDMGFTAIWISPVVENLEGNTPDGSAYHGYWAQNIYEINPHFGTAADLKALSVALHNRGMYLMVDVVVNHMGYYGSPSSINYSVFDPFDNQNYYHPYCPIDYNNATSITNCWEGDTIVPLPDLRTEDTDVQKMWTTWLKQLVKNYTIDGIRLDSAQQTGILILPLLEKSSNVYIVGEDFNGDPPEACVYQNYLNGILNYPAYFWITQAFQDSTGSMFNLYNGTTWMQSQCRDTTLLGSFSENHDNPRFPSYTEDVVRAENVVAFTVLQDGIPIIYQGQEQHYNGDGVPVNREAIWLSGYNTTSPLYTFIKSINAIRAHVIAQTPAYVTDQIVPVYYDDHTIVTRKGKTGAQVVGVYSNLGENGEDYELQLNASQTLFTKNEKVVELLSCTLLMADKTGNVVVPMGGGEPKVLYPYSKLSGSGICSSTTPPATTQNTTCTPATITFDLLVNTTYGQSVIVTGSIPQLGTWTPQDGVYLNADNYTESNPLWIGTVSGVDPEEVLEYKFVVENTDGSLTWQNGANLQMTAPGGCNPTTTVANVWPGPTPA